MSFSYESDNVTYEASEYRVQFTSNGEWIMARKPERTLFTLDDRRQEIIFGIVPDITERKKAEGDIEEKLIEA